MAILERGTGAVLQDTANAASYLMNLQPELVNGDLLLLAVESIISSGEATTPNGWTVLYQLLWAGNATFSVYSKVRADETTVTIPFTGTQLNCIAVCLALYSDEGELEVVTPVPGGIQDLTSDNTMDFPAVTPTDAGADAHILAGSLSIDGVGGVNAIETVAGFTKRIAHIEVGAADEGAVCLQYDLLGSNFAAKTAVTDTSQQHSGAFAIHESVLSSVSVQSAVAAASSAW